MTSTSRGDPAPRPAPTPAQNQQDDGPVPRRSRPAVIIPILVLALTLLVVGWSAWPTLRPVRDVAVTQVVFDRSLEAAVVPTTAPGDAAQPPARDGAPTSDVTVQAAGWLEAEPFFIACTALADGVVETMQVLEGDRVEKGQIVATLVAEDSELRLARAEADLDVARAELGLAEAELVAAQRDWDELVDRTRAIETAKAEVAEAEAELAQLPSLIRAATARLIRRQEELKREELSRERNASTDLDVIVAQQHVEAQRAVVASLEAQRPMLEARIERLRADRRAAERHMDLRIEERLRLDSAEASLARTKASVARAAAIRDEAALELERMVIRAPIDGYVQRRIKVPGDKVVRGMDDPHSSHLVHLYDPERIQVRVDVPLADASHVFVGQRCEVIIEVLPDTTFAGEVLLTTHEADLQKNTLEVKVKVLDPSPLLRPEMLTRVRFLPRGATRGASGAERPVNPSERVASARVLVPSEALDAAGGAPRVWTVRDRRGDRGIARPVRVEPLQETDEGWMAVTGPLHPGELLVVSAQGLRAGQRVRISPAPKEASQ